MDIRRVRRDAESFVRAMDKEYYQNWAGLKDELNTTAIFAKYEHLFTVDAVGELKQRREGAEGDDSRRLRYLHALLANEYLGNAVRDLSDRKDTWEAQAKVAVDGEEIPFRLSAVRMANEDDRGRRSALFEARNLAMEEINPVLMERVRKLHALAKDLGYQDYVHLYGDIKGIDFHFLKGALDDLLKRTEAKYVEAMEAKLRPLHIPLDQAEKHDVAYAFRAKAFDGLFPKDKAVATLEATLKGLGFDLRSQKNIVLDNEERPKKSPRAFCAPLEVPSKVMLVVMPQGGFGDYDTLLHEAGHAEHFAHVTKNQRMEYKYLGDNSVTESYAFLLQYLPSDPQWLAQYMGVDDTAPFLAHAWLEKLFFLRRYAAKLHYELELHTQGVENMGLVYRVVMESALRFRHPEVHYLLDLDDGFYSAQYLRAWIFEAQLRAVLRENFGERWFVEESSGRFLRNLWKGGQKFSVEELAENLGYPGLNAEPLADELAEAPLIP